MRTGRDVVVAALLGADEYGFSTAPLIVEGCLMMRKCHLNTCPVGVATQNKELRKRFKGKPEHVVNYFIMVAQEARELMAKLGFRTINEMIGRSDLLEKRRMLDHWKTEGLDFSKVFFKPEVADDVATYWCETQDHGLEKALDNELIKQAQPALEKGDKVVIETPVCNMNRTFGTMLSGEVARRYGHDGLPDDTIVIKAKGTAGQSLGAWLAKGVTIDLTGEANDYVGKGMSGGKIIVRPPAETPIIAEENIIVGNTLLYGAIAGECYFRGVAGERFGVRNSGVKAVIEGVGDHCCEYMTGGVVLCIGPTGRNFAAGMSGGIAYVLDEAGDFEKRINMQQVELERFEDMADDPHLDISSDPLADDAVRVKRMLQKHVEYTDSAVAKRILENWSAYLPKFYKIVPIDYRRALLELRAKEQQAAAGGQ